MKPKYLTETLVVGPLEEAKYMKTQAERKRRGLPEVSMAKSIVLSRGKRAALERKRQKQEEETERHNSLYFRRRAGV